MTSTAVQTRTKTRINLLVERIIATLNDYPSLSINAVAVASEWTQSSFLRACESREIELPQREGRDSIEQLLAGYAKARDFDSITLLMDAVDHLVDAQTCDVIEPEPEVKPVKEKKITKKEQKALDKAAAALEAGEEPPADGEGDELDNSMGEGDFETTFQDDQF